MGGPAPKSVSIVCTDRDRRHRLSEILDRRGYRAKEQTRSSELFEDIEATGDLPSIVILEVRAGNEDDHRALQKLVANHWRIPIIVLSTSAEAAAIVRVIQGGAVDCLVPPYADAELVRVIDEAPAPETLEAKPVEANRWVVAYPFIAASPAMREIERVTRQVADSDLTVLIHGESGTGKEVVARHIHRCSQRSRAPFVKVNCAALPDELLETELFGHEKGAFTGADSQKPGKFELADRGTKSFRPSALPFTARRRRSSSVKRSLFPRCRAFRTRFSSNK